MAYVHDEFVFGSRGLWVYFHRLVILGADLDLQLGHDRHGAGRSCEVSPEQDQIIDVPDRQCQRDR